jgi:hypothetical protein
MQANREYIEHQVNLAGASAGVKTEMQANSPGDGKTRYSCAVVGEHGAWYRDKYMGAGIREAEAFARGVDWCLSVLEYGDKEIAARFYDRQVAYWDSINANKIR